MHYAVCLSYLQVILFLDTIFFFFFFLSEGENSECEERAVIETHVVCHALWQEVWGIGDQGS